MKTRTKVHIAKPAGTLGILIPGLNGAVSTTFLAGVMAARRGLGKPIGSLTQMGTIRLGKRTEHRSPLIRDFVPLAPLKNLVFGGWDIRKETCFQSATKAGVLQAEHL
ncbi:MAG TPA: inositol-3-phosphate synthase, partial [Bacteroidota bacterium]|nr:inositol-3-phosphate synthase [Bacteroidota bacterium]